MSERMRALVAEHSHTVRTLRIVMIELADRADDRGNCAVTLEELARSSRISHRTAQRAVARLEDAGEITCIGGGNGRGDKIRFRLEVAVVQNLFTSVDNRADMGDTRAPGKGDIRDASRAPDYASENYLITSSSDSRAGPGVDCGLPAHLRDGVPADEVPARVAALRDALARGARGDP